MKSVVKFLGGRKFLINYRNHEIISDLAQEKGGTDEGPNPPELLIASLGACIGVYTCSYLQQVNIPYAGLEIELDWDFAQEPLRIGRIDITLKNLARAVGKRKEALLNVASHCLIANTLESKPQIKMKLEE